MSQFARRIWAVEGGPICPTNQSAHPSTWLMGQHLCDLPVIGDLSHLYQRMRVFVSFQKVLEGWAGACQDHFVSLDSELTLA